MEDLILDKVLRHYPLLFPPHCNSNLLIHPLGMVVEVTMTMGMIQMIGYFPCSHL